MIRMIRMIDARLGLWAALTLTTLVHAILAYRTHNLLVVSWLSRRPFDQVFPQHAKRKKGRKEGKQHRHPRQHPHHQQQRQQQQKGRRLLTLPHSCSLWCIRLQADTPTHPPTHTHTYTPLLCLSQTHLEPMPSIKGTASVVDNHALKKQLKKTRFPKIFNEKVSLDKINIPVLSQWIETELERLLGMDDEIVSSTAINLFLDNGSAMLEPKKAQLQLGGFLGESEAAAFCKKLWSMMLDAQKQSTGIPKVLLEQKKKELAKQREAQEAIAAKAAAVVRSQPPARQSRWQQRPVDQNNSVMANRPRVPHQDHYSNHHRPNYQRQDHRGGHAPTLGGRFQPPQPRPAPPDRRAGGGLPPGFVARNDDNRESDNNNNGLPPRAVSPPRRLEEIKNEKDEEEEEDNDRSSRSPSPRRRDERDGRSVSSDDDDDSDDVHVSSRGDNDDDDSDSTGSSSEDDESDDDDNDRRGGRRRRSSSPKRRHRDHRHRDDHDRHHQSRSYRRRRSRSVSSEDSRSSSDSEDSTRRERHHKRYRR